jgi:protein SCO1/2
MYFFVYKSDTFMKSPPILGERKGVENKEIDGKQHTDTIYHTIPNFSFLNQNGTTITQEKYKGKIYVADFFFTSCQTICPKMTKQLSRLQTMFKPEREIKYNILSHTVNPTEDSVAVLRHYADSFQVIDSIWDMVTGDKAMLYEIARKGYLLPVDEGNGGEDDFIHSEKLVLVDWAGRIRGFFDGTDSMEVKKLADAIVLLNLNKQKLDNAKPSHY